MLKSGLSIGRDRYPSQTSYLKKGTGSCPNQTSGRSWAKLGLKLGPGHKKAPRLPIPRSFSATFLVCWLFPLQPEAHFFSIAGNINPVALW